MTIFISCQPRLCVWTRMLKCENASVMLSPNVQLKCFSIFIYSFHSIVASTFHFLRKIHLKKWGTVECFSPDLTDEDLIQKFTFGFVPLVSLRPFPVFKNGFLTATLTPRPFLTRLQWAVDGSTEGSDPSLRSCVILAGLQGHDLQTIMDAICCAFGFLGLSSTCPVYSFF